MRFGLGDDAEPASRAAADVTGPIETTGRSRPSAAKARAADADASTTRSASGKLGRELDGAVEHLDVRAELAASSGARVLGAGEEHAAGLRRGNAATSPSCVETSGTRSGSTPCTRSASAVPGPIAATFGSRPSSRAKSASTPWRLVRTTQS